MTTIDKLHAIEAVATIYNIHYCNAGIGMNFYEPGRSLSEAVIAANKERNNKERLEAMANHRDAPPIYDGWRRNLVTYHYYPTFEAMVDAEYERVVLQPPF